MAGQPVLPIRLFGIPTFQSVSFPREGQVHGQVCTSAAVKVKAKVKGEFCCMLKLTVASVARMFVAIQ